MLMEMDPELNEAGEKLKELSADEKARYLAESRFRSQFAYELEITAREEKGRNEEKIEIAKKMIARGTNFNIISEDTGLTILELEQIKADLTL